MNLAEKILVIIDFEVSYNICSGGHGGFGYINDILTFEQRSKIGQSPKKRRVHNEKSLKSIRKNIQYAVTFVNIPRRQFLAGLAAKRPEVMKKRKDTFQKIKHAQGENNSQYGTCWITNGQENKKIKKRSS
jgi:hypothetical protein